MPRKLSVDSVRQVFNDGNHNAFTDMCAFGGRYYLTFRNCPDGHSLHATSRIMVLSSVDAKNWQIVHTFGQPEPNRDVRGPHLVVFKDTLFVYCSTWLVHPEDPGKRDLNEHRGYCCWSRDGETWHGPRFLEGTQGHFVWGAASRGDKTYLCGRRKEDFAVLPTLEEGRAITKSALLESDDGFAFRTVGFFREEYGDEASFLFEEDGSLVAVTRGAPGSEPGWVCRSKPPYSEWTRVKLDRNIGGPMLKRWGDDYLVGGRKTIDPTNPKTTLYWLVNDQLEEIVELPSGGDNSYPGFIELSPNRGLLSYYSSHEGSGTTLAPCAIYLAELTLE